jgi:hypothetical protein
MKLTGENRSTRGEKPATLFTTNPTWTDPTSAVKGQRLTAWAIARYSDIKPDFTFQCLVETISVMVLQSMLQPYRSWSCKVCYSHIGHGPATYVTAISVMVLQSMLQPYRSWSCKVWYTHVGHAPAKYATPYRSCSIKVCYTISVMLQQSMLHHFGHDPAKYATPYRSCSSKVCYTISVMVLQSVLQPYPSILPIIFNIFLAN